jgi:hypothetical protein
LSSGTGHAAAVDGDFARRTRSFTAGKTPIRMGLSNFVEGNFCKLYDRPIVQCESVAFLSRKSCMRELRFSPFVNIFTYILLEDPIVPTFI